MGYLLDESSSEWLPTKFELFTSGIQVESGLVADFIPLVQVTGLFEAGAAIDGYLPLEIVLVDTSIVRARLSPSFLDSLLEALVLSLAEKEPPAVTSAAPAGPPVFIPPDVLPQQSDDQLINLQTLELAEQEAPIAQNEYHPTSPEPSEPAAVAVTVMPAPICPYCQSPVDGSSATCDSCHAVHHNDCWAESGACSVPGCHQSQAASRVAATALAGVGAAQIPSPTGNAGAWGSPRTDAPIAPGIEFGATADSVQHEFSAPAKPKRAFRTVLVVLLLIGLPILAVFGTMKNWWEPITGHVYSEDEVLEATDTAQSEGYDSGKSDGYDEGKSDGNTEGFAAGIEKGCELVFETLDTSVVYDTRSPYATAYYMSKSTCYE